MSTTVIEKCPLRPLEDRVIVVVEQADEATPGGILLSDGAKKKTCLGTVWAVGPGGFKGLGQAFNHGNQVDDEPYLPNRSVKPGDRVLYSRYGGTEIKVEGVTCVLLHINDVYSEVAEGTQVEIILPRPGM